MPSLIGDYFTTIQQGIGEKYGNLISALFSFLSGLGIAFYEAPIYAFICLAYFPFIFFVIAMIMKSVKIASIKKVETVKKLGGLTEESLTAIKLVASFA